MKTVARILAICGIVLLVTPGPAVAAAAVPDVFESTATAGGLHVTLSVPAFFEAFGPYSRAEATNGSSHSLQAPFYLGFFLTAAIEQFGFPPLPGTTETLYPQGPTTAGTEEAPVDADVIESSGTSTETGASGRSVVTRGALEPLVDLGLGSAASSVKADAGGVTATSSISMDGIDIFDGLLTIDQVTGNALARSTGKAGGGSTEGTVNMTGVKIAGVPIDVIADGVIVAGTPLVIGGDDIPGLSDLLSVSGITIERLPDERILSANGQIAEIHVGGIRITLAQAAAEFEVTVTLGDLVARSRVVDLAANETPSTGDSDGGTDVGGSASTPGRTITTPGTTIPGLASRTVRTTGPVGAGNWVAVAAAAALVAPLLLIVRRAFRAAVRP